MNLTPSRRAAAAQNESGGDPKIKSPNSSARVRIMKGHAMPKESIKQSAVTALSAFIGVVAAIWGLSVSVGDRLWVTKTEFTPVKEDIAAIKAVMSIRGEVTARRRGALHAANANED